MSRRFLPIPRHRFTPRSSREDDPQYLNFIRSLPCLICAMLHRRQSGRTEAAHIGQRGLGQKCSDRETAPLCQLHHREGEHAHHRLGKRFWTFWKLNRVEVIQKYQRDYGKFSRAA